MAKKRKRGRKMPAWKKYARGALKLVGTGVGSLIATAPLHRGLRSLASGNFEAAAEEIVHDTTGLSTVDPAFQIDVSKLIRVGVLAGVGIGIMKLFGVLARRV